MDLKNQTQKREIKFRAWGDEMMHSHEDIVKYWSALELLTDLEDGYIVMQYTGLKDKNGVEIYEGDILDGMGVVKYETSAAEFLCEDITGFSAIHEGADMEVIGNIYKNPELL